MMPYPLKVEPCCGHAHVCQFCGQRQEGPLYTVAFRLVKSDWLTFARKTDEGFHEFQVCHECLEEHPDGSTALASLEGKQ